jgi:hypothetical protein
MNFWINSNSGDYIIEHNGTYQLILISRVVDGKYLTQDRVELTKAQFESIKGFVPIKQKKLFNRQTHYDLQHKYAPTNSDGTKGESVRYNPPSIQDIRNYRLKNLGL